MDDLGFRSPQYTRRRYHRVRFAYRRRSHGPDSVAGPWVSHVWVLSVYVVVLITMRLHISWWARHIFDSPETTAGKDLKVASEVVSWTDLVATFKRVTGTAVL